jgi:hypothetical protein
MFLVLGRRKPALAGQGAGSRRFGGDGQPFRLRPKDSGCAIDRGGVGGDCGVVDEAWRRHQGLPYGVIVQCGGCLGIDADGPQRRFHLADDGVTARFDDGQFWGFASNAGDSVALLIVEIEHHSALPRGMCSSWCRFITVWIHDLCSGYSSFRTPPRSSTVAAPGKGACARPDPCAGRRRAAPVLPSPIFSCLHPSAR